MYIVCWTRPGKIRHGNSGDTIAGIAYELSLRYGVRDCTEGRKPGVGSIGGSYPNGARPHCLVKVHAANDAIVAGQLPVLLKGGERR